MAGASEVTPVRTGSSKTAGLRTLRILLLAEDVDLTARSGDAVHARELARALAARGHRVDLVVGASDPTAADLRPRVHLHALRSSSTLTAIRAAIRIARRSSTGVIYERRLSPKVGFAVSWVVRVPFCIEVNGVEEESTLLGRPRHREKGIRFQARRRMYHRAAAIVAVSSGLASVVARRYDLPRERISTIPNGVDVDRFLPMDSGRARAQLGWPDVPSVVFVGNLVPWQGVDVLISATVEIARRVPRVRVIIIGDGPMRAELERYAARLRVDSHVRFTGAVPYEDVPIRIAAATVCTAPFTRERNEAIGLSPLKLYEYMAAARPVVASDVPGVGDVLRSTGAGIPVPPGEPSPLAEAVVALLQDPLRARSMGEKGRSSAVADFSWAKAAERVESVLRSIVVNPTRR